MRCHYVPQCYLKQFSIRGKPGYLYAYQRQRKPFVTQTVSIAAKNDLYIFTDIFTGQKNDEVEKIFSYLEGLVTPILEKLAVETNPLLTNNDHNILSEFIAYLSIRNLSHREKTKNLYAEITKIHLKNLAGNKENFTEILRESKAKINPDDKKEVEKLRQSISNFDKHFKIDYSKKENDDIFLRKSLELGLKIIPIFFNKEWHIFESPSRVFITSDNPVAIIRPEGLPMFRGVGLENGNIAVPISPKRCLFLQNGDSSLHPTITKVSREKVDLINRHIMFYAYKFIYTNLISRDIKNNFNKTKEGESEKVVTL